MYYIQVKRSVCSQQKFPFRPEKTDTLDYGWVWLIRVVIQSKAAQTINIFSTLIKSEI